MTAEASPCDDRLSPLFTWRSAVASRFGPKATTRHVLLTLSLHMNERGGSCFPATTTLADETGLSRRAVEEHIRLAEETGWIRRKEVGLSGQRWRRKSYTASVPEAARKGLREERDRDETEEKGAERGSIPSSEKPAKVGNLATKGWEGRSQEVVIEDVKRLAAEEFPLGDERVPKTRKKKQRIRVPEDFEPAAEHEAEGKKLGMSADEVTIQAGRFRIHHRKRWFDTYADVDEEFSKWLLTEASFRAQRNGGRVGQKKGPKVTVTADGTRILHR